MSYYSRLAYEIWEKENLYAEDDCSPSWETAEEPGINHSAQEDEVPFAA